MQNFIELTKAVHSFAPISEDLIKSLYAVCKEKKIQKNEYFIRAGDESRYMALTLKGLFRLFYTDTEGNEFTKGFNRSGQFLISYSAFVQNRPSFFSIQALQNSTILQFDFHCFNKMMQDDIRWYPFTYKLLESVYILKELREKSLLLEDAAHRYSIFKQDFASIENQIKLTHIASYLGITPETLSRIRKKLYS